MWLPLLLDMGDFLPYALSAPPTGPCAQSSAPSSLPQGLPASPWGKPEMF
jgi:hypothetical protein